MANDPTIPSSVPCEGCGKDVPKEEETCAKCEHPTADSVIAYAEPYGGLDVLAKIREAWEYRLWTTELILSNNQIADITPLAGLTAEGGTRTQETTDITLYLQPINLEKLHLDNNQIADVTPLKGMTKLIELNLHNNQIVDVTPLKGMTKLERLTTYGNPIPATQKVMLRKALPKCEIVG